MVQEPNKKKIEVLCVGIAVIDVFGKRAELESSLMGRGLLSYAARKSQKVLGSLD